MNFKEAQSTVLELINSIEPNEFRIWNLYNFNGQIKRYELEIQYINSLSLGSGSRVLEIGSFPYHMTALCKLHDINITPLAYELHTTNPIVSNLGLDLVKCNIETDAIPFGDNTFDLVLFNEVFEHLRINPIATLQEIHRVLKPGGILYLTTPNFYSLRNIYRMMQGKGFDDPYTEFSKLGRFGTMGHVREYTKQQVSKFLEKTGFKIDSVAFHCYDKRVYLKPVYAMCPSIRTNIRLISKKA